MAPALPHGARAAAPRPRLLIYSEESDDDGGLFAPCSAAGGGAAFPPAAAAAAAAAPTKQRRAAYARAAETMTAPGYTEKAVQHEEADGDDDEETDTDEEDEDEATEDSETDEDEDEDEGGKPAAAKTKRAAKKPATKAAPSKKPRAPASAAAASTGDNADNNKMPNSLAVAVPGKTAADLRKDSKVLLMTEDALRSRATRGGPVDKPGDELLSDVRVAGLRDPSKFAWSFHLTRDLLDAGGRPTAEVEAAAKAGGFHVNRSGQAGSKGYFDSAEKAYLSARRARTAVGMPAARRGPGYGVRYTKDRKVNKWLAVLQYDPYNKNMLTSLGSHATLRLACEAYDTYVRDKNLWLPVLGERAARALNYASDGEKAEIAAVIAAIRAAVRAQAKKDLWVIFGKKV